MKAARADGSRCLLFMGHFIILPNGVLTEQNANLVYENEVWWEWTSCFSILPAVGVGFVRTVGQKENRKEMGGGTESAEGFQFVLTGLMMWVCVWLFAGD